MGHTIVECGRIGDSYGAGRGRPPVAPESEISHLREAVPRRSVPFCRNTSILPIPHQAGRMQSFRCIGPCHENARNMASIQRLTSPLTARISYRVQVRLKGHSTQSQTFRSRKDAERWAASIESAILERRHFPHTRAQRISFEALAQRDRENILTDAGASRM